MRGVVDACRWCAVPMWQGAGCVTWPVAESHFPRCRTWWTGVLISVYCPVSCGKDHPHGPSANSPLLHAMCKPAPMIFW